MTAEGSFTVAYLQDNLDAAGNVASTSIYYRIYHESTDTAGPIVTDTTLVTTSGETADLNISNTATVQNGVSYAVVNVSEALYDNLTKTGNAASNPANYVLYDSNGKAITGAISAVYFGLERSGQSGSNGGRRSRHCTAASRLSNATPSGKYEIVLAFDANGPAGGVTALTTGTYTLKIVDAHRRNASNPAGTTGITDVAGNNLNYTGYNPAGSNFSVKFSIAVTSDTTTDKTGTEILVNQTTDGVQTTTSTGLNVAGDSASTRIRRLRRRGRLRRRLAAVRQRRHHRRLHAALQQRRQPLDRRNAGQHLHHRQSDRSLGGDGRRRRLRRRLGQPRPRSRRQLGNLRPAVQFGWERRSAASSASTPSPPTIRSRPPSPWTATATSSSCGPRRDSRTATSTASRDKSTTATATSSAANSPSTPQNVPGTGLTASNNELHPSIAMSDVGTFVVAWTAVISQTNSIATNSVVVGRMFTWDSTGATPMLITTTSTAKPPPATRSSRSASATNDFIADDEPIPNDRLAAGAFMASNAAGGDELLGPVHRHLGSLPGQRLGSIPTTDVVNSYGIYYRQYNDRRHAEDRGGRTGQPGRHRVGSAQSLLAGAIGALLRQSVESVGQHGRGRRFHHHLERQRIEHDDPVESRRSGGRLRSRYQRRVGALLPLDGDRATPRIRPSSTEFRVNSTGQRNSGKLERRHDRQRRRTSSPGPAREAATPRASISRSTNRRSTSTARP